MEHEEFEFEELEISISVGLSLNEFDFVVGSFEAAGRDRVVVPVEDAFAVGWQGAGELHELFDAARSVSW